MNANRDPQRTTTLYDSNTQDPTRATQVLNNPARGTSVMPNHNPARTTSVMPSRATTQSASLLTEGTIIDGYSVVRTITENTGEATLLLAQKDGSQYVLKIYHKDTKPKQELRDSLKALSDPHVMPTLVNGTWNDRYYEVLPFYSEGDLGSCQNIDIKTLREVIIPGVNAGLHALHAKGIVHRDIKPSNIFFTNNHTSVVVGDFGISSVLNTNMSVRATGMARTLGYAAPETSTGYISKESDYYSFGVTLLHIVLGKDPFEGMTDMQILFQTVNEGLNIPSSVDPDIASLIKGLTIKDRTLRWGYDEVIAWLKGAAPALPEKGNVRKTLSGKAARPYRFANQYYTSLSELERAFARDWTNAKKHLYRGLIENYLKLYGEDLASECMDLREMADKDAAVFRLLYLPNPNAPLNWQGIDFVTTQNLSRYIFNGYPNSYKFIAPMIMGGSLRYYLKMHQQLSPDLEAMLSRCESSGDISASTFITIAYILNPMQGYKFLDEEYHTLEELVSFLVSLNATDCEADCGLLMKDTFFKAWLRSLGYEAQLASWEVMLRKGGWNT